MGAWPWELYRVIQSWGPRNLHGDSPQILGQELRDAWIASLDSVNHSGGRLRAKQRYQRSHQGWRYWDCGPVRVENPQWKQKESDQDQIRRPYLMSKIYILEQGACPRTQNKNSNRPPKKDSTKSDQIKIDQLYNCYQQNPQ